MKNISIFPLLIMGVFLVFASSCNKDDDNNINPSSNNQPNGKTTAVFNPDVSYGTMTDQDGNTYKIVTIGTQTWMAENLRTTIYNDGTAIPNVTDSNEWCDLTTGAYCNYNNTTDQDTIATFGRLYNWYAVNTGLLAPKGWHIPTYDEWKTLTDYLGGEYVAGEKLKEEGTSHWYTPNQGATNESGFTALPGGIRGYIGKSFYIGNYNYSWSATAIDATGAWGCLMYYNYSYVSINYYYSMELGLSVRCVRD